MKKYALVTGGSRGIGAAIASQLAADGYHVIINYRSNSEAAKETLRAIEDAGGEGELLPFDVTEEHTVDEALEQWEERHPDAYISVLVNNAGVRSDNLMVFMETEQWNRVMGASLNGFFFVTRRLLKNMMTHRIGRFGCQGRNDRRHEGAGPGGGTPQGHCQRRRSRLHTQRHDQGPERSRTQEDSAHEPIRRTSGGGRSRIFPRLPQSILHHRTDHINQRRSVLTQL